jgi:cyclin-dependent kinase regulatory subunit CKS1
MSETEWRNLGVQQSVGWVHFMLHTPEPHILMFRRPLHKEVDDDEDEEEGETHAT